MTRVTEATVEHIAKLAHLELTPEERALFTRHLQQILSYAESLQALATADVPPMSHARSSEIFRTDSPVDGLSREAALAAGPDVESGLFRVPKVIGG
jgi:aspartyl-tRNA(Asn)/glutamyl-tRNA(Gln) amidotransferase subunit C